MRAPGVRRFLRYAVVGNLSTAFDLSLLYALTSLLGVPLYFSTPTAFLIAASVNYAISRDFVFRGTARSWRRGYAYFILIALAGAGITTACVVLLVDYAGLYYLLARILVAGFIGVGNFLINLHYNFRVAGCPFNAPAKSSSLH